MLSKIFKETLLISWWKTVISGTIGGIFTYFTVAKSLGAEPITSILCGIGFLVSVYILRSMYIWGKLSEGEKLTTELEAVKNSELLPLREKLLKIEAHFINSLSKLNHLFSAIHFLSG